jgi:hypothetical protein
MTFHDWRRADDVADHPLAERKAGALSRDLEPVKRAPKVSLHRREKLALPMGRVSAEPTKAQSLALNSPLKVRQPNVNQLA